MKVKLKRERLERELARRNLSLNHWGHKLGLSRGHLSRLVNGKRPYPSPSTRRKLLQGLEVDFDDLFEVVHDRTRSSPGNSRGAPKGDSSMQALLQDIRFAARSLSRHPAFALTAVVTLALGIGANAAIFSAVSAILLDPLPFRDSDRLAAVWNRLERTGPGFTHLSGPEYMDYRERNRSFESLAAGFSGDVTLTGRGEPQRLSASYASVNLFETLGAAPVLGRGFQPSDGHPDSARVAVISHSLWQGAFAAQDSAIGQLLTLDGESFEVVGVLPPGFGVHAPEMPLLEPKDVYLPFPYPYRALERDSRGLVCVGRLKPGASLSQARSDLESVAAALREEYAEDYRDKGFRSAVVPLSKQVAGDSRAALLALQGTVAFLLLLVCVNLATIQVARASARRVEVAVRMALGAGRMRLARQFLAEALLAALPGGIGAAGLAWLGVAAIRALGPESVPRLDEIAVDGGVLAFALGASLLAALLFGLAPAAQISLGKVAGALHGGGRSSSDRASELRFRQALLCAQVALALMLTVGSGLMLRSLLHLQSVDAGFRADGVLTFSVSLPASRYSSRQSQVDFFQRLEQRLTRVPGIENAGAVSRLPFSHTDMSGGVTIEDPASQPGPVKFELARRHATPGYFHAMGIDLVEGRLFDGRDRADSQPVALIDDSLAERLWPGQSPVGKRLHRGGPQADRPWRTIVGVVRHVRHRGLDAQGREQVYFPLSQQADATSFMFVAARASGKPSGVIQPLRKAVAEIDPLIPVAGLATMEERVSGWLSQPRFYSLLLGMFALLGLCLGASGIYALMSYSVHRRAREIGVRLALGARSREVFAMVVARAMALTAAGVALGLAASLALGGYLSTLLYQVPAADPATLSACAAFLFLIALAASASPAWRASRVDPIRTLRAE